MIRSISLAVALGFLVCACGPQRPFIDPALDSGVTSSNGGGVRQTGGYPSINLGPNGTTTGGSNQAGRAY